MNWFDNHSNSCCNSQDNIIIEYFAIIDCYYEVCKECGMFIKWLKGE
jgi:hypothetical protein